MTQETKPLPNIARRAIALVNVEMQKTILEAAELVDANLAEGWRLTSDGSAFVREMAEEPSKNGDGDPKPE